jgi:ankyrin repeat protein
MAKCSFIDLCKNIKTYDALCLLKFHWKKCNINFIDKDGCTALIWACYNSMNEVAFKIVRMFPASCNMSHVDKFGYNAFHYACKNGLKKAINRMLEFASRKDLKLSCVDYHRKSNIWYVYSHRLYNTIIKMIKIDSTLAYELPQVSDNLFIDILMSLNSDHHVKFVVKQNKLNFLLGRIKELQIVYNRTDDKSESESTTTIKSKETTNIKSNECFICNDTDNVNSYMNVTCGHIYFICKSCLIPYNKSKKCALCRERLFTKKCYLPG